MIEELASKIRDGMPAPWDQLREQRVLRALVEGKRARARRRRMAWAGASALAAILGIAVVIVVLSRGRPPAPRAPVTVAEPSTMTLMDGSRLSLPESARVDIEREQSDAVELRQTSGRVGYDVTKKPERSFVVHAGDVVVTVVGTRFSVAIEGDRVAVEVERGRVRVDSGGRAVELGPGESVRVDATAPPRIDSSDAGVDADAVSAPDDAGARRVSIGASADELLQQADAARSAGNLGAAEAALQDLLTRFPRDSRAAGARFTLGRVERARGNHAAAARSFGAITSGPLAEDALAEAAQSWLAAGSTAEARAAAEKYLARFPGGPHVARMRRILE